MTDAWQLFAILLTAVNPAAVAAVARFERAERWRAAAIALAVAAAVLGAAALLADPLLEALEVEPESARTAAGLVMAAAGLATIARFVLAPWSAKEPAADIPAAWVGWPMAAGPAAVAATISLAADTADGRVLAAAVVPVVLAIAGVALGAGGALVVRAGATLLATGLVVFAVALVVSGVRDV